ncbi:TetR/AcrR family transcriptional regulator [Nocardia thailandica]|uniref:TetR/AcrR family transcriptional regulator n=1 Tax=Nocardia thailandica TaxID=257275 RepID=A0ABW6PTJ9_9NOCA
MFGSPRRVAPSVRIRRQARREQLLAIAQRAFATHGYHGATMARVGRSANITKPVLYRYFSGKLELYLAVIQRSLDELNTAVRRALDSARSETEAVHATVHAIFDLVDRDATPAEVLVGPAVPDEPSAELSIRSAWNECAQTVAAGLGPDRSPTQARLLASAVLGAALTGARDWHRAGRPIPKGEAADLIARLPAAGLRAAPAAQGARPSGSPPRSPGRVPD